MDLMHQPVLLSADMIIYLIMVNTCGPYFLQLRITVIFGHLKKMVGNAHNCHDVQYIENS